VDATLDSTAARRPDFFTTQWGMVTAASAEGTTEARAALDGLYRVYYAFIRRRGYGRQDAQDLTQDFFVSLLEKSALARADPQRGWFRSFLLGTLDHFLAMRPNAPAPANGAASASLFTWTTTQRKTATNSRRG
jgi:hypothetical protein